MSTPTVSVVMPVFNGLPYLVESVDSALTQSHPDVELVLVDGGSSDGSREWVEAFEHPRVVKDYLPAGTPAGVTWTRASELATGEYIKLLCQDDLIYPHALAVQAADLMSAPTAGMAIAQRDLITATGETLYRGRGCAGLAAGVVDGVHALEVACWRGANIYGEPLAVLFRSDAMRQALPWVDDHPFLLDMFFYAKVLERHDVIVRRESIGAFRISSSSWSTRLMSRQRAEFHAWQHHIERDIAPQPWYRIVESRVNTERTTLLRRSAYSWLRLKNPFHAHQPPAGH